MKWTLMTGGGAGEIAADGIRIVLSRHVQTLCHELTEGGRLTPVPLDSAVSRWRDGDGAFWIEVTGRDEQALEALLRDLGVTDFLTQRCLDAGSTTIVVATPKGTYVDVTVFADQACTRRAPVTALALKRLLLTMQPEPIEHSLEIRDAIESLEIARLSPSRVLGALMLEHATMTGRKARQLRERVLDFGAVMDRTVENADPEELEELVQSILLTLAVADEQQHVFSLLPNAESEGFAASKMPALLGLLGTTATATERLARRLDNRAENLLRRQQDYKQELLNRRLGVLTIVSAIFLPLTLMAGIWGMNFEHMPELDEPYAYWGALTLMALLGLGGAWVFYKRGWFD